MNSLTQAQTNSQLAVTSDPAAIAAAEAAKSRLQAAYQMALYQPRNVEQARQNLLAACRRPAFAEKAEYNKPVGGSSIVGPSIRFAETAIREWGNILSDISVVYEDDSTRRIRVNMIDLQTNSQFTKELSIRKTVERRFAKDREVLGERENSRGEVVYIVRATDDEIANKEAAMISKAVRNEGLRLIPSDIIDEALETARETLRSQIKDDPSKHRRKVIDAFAGIGVKVASLEKYLGHEIDSCSPGEIAELRNIYGSIKDGEASWNDYLELKRKSTSEDEDERRTAVDALTALANRKPVKETEPKQADKVVGNDKQESKQPAQEDSKPTKGKLIAEVMSLLDGEQRTQKDLIEWAKRNKHIPEDSTVSSIQGLNMDLLSKVIENWKKIVL